MMVGDRGTIPTLACLASALLPFKRQASQRFSQARTLAPTILSRASALERAIEIKGLAAPPQCGVPVAALACTSKQRLF